jgi:hypothetical protein
LESTSIRPPMSSVRRRVTNRPRPDPPKLMERKLLDAKLWSAKERSYTVCVSELACANPLFKPKLANSIKR